MRRLLLIPASLALTIAIGVGACVGTGRNPHTTAMLAAAAAVVIASVAGLVPMLFTTAGSQLVATQAALVGSMVHLFTVAIAAVVVVLGSLLPGMAFLSWLLAMYWMSLAALVVVYAGAIRSAPPATHPGPSPKA